MSDVEILAREAASRTGWTVRSLWVPGTVTLMREYKRDRHTVVFDVDGMECATYVGTTMVFAYRHHYPWDRYEDVIRMMEMGGVWE